MTFSDTSLIIQRMQEAVDIVLTGEHETSRVAACIFNGDAHFASVSLRPACFKPHFAWDGRIGASSQFIHAELAVIAGFDGPLRGASLCVTDPFCPNCAKNMAEAGIRTIYIDHKGFQKDFIARNGDEFKAMSMLIAEKAGISVYVVNRKEGSVTPLLEQATQTRPSPSSIEFFDIDAGQTLESVMATFKKRFGGREAWSVAFVREADGSRRGLLVFEALPPGITPDDFVARGGMDTGKYRFPLDPLTRILITMKRMGMTLLDGRVGCGKAPSSRAIVNMLGFGVSRLLLGSGVCEHDPLGPVALELCQDKQLVSMMEI